MSSAGRVYAAALAVCSMLIAGCGLAPADDVTQGQLTSTELRDPRPSQLAVEFTRRAIRGEDVSHLVIDERGLSLEGPVVPDPERPRAIAAMAATWFAGIGATAENAPYLRLPQEDGTFRELEWPDIFGPGCAIPGDVTVVCSVVLRNPLGEGLVNVALVTRRGTRDWFVFHVAFDLPLPAFTG